MAFLYNLILANDCHKLHVLHFPPAFSGTQARVVPRCLCPQTLVKGGRSKVMSKVIVHVESQKFMWVLFHLSCDPRSARAPPLLYTDIMHTLLLASGQNHLDLLQ